MSDNTMGRIEFELERIRVDREKEEIEKQRWMDEMQARMAVGPSTPKWLDILNPIAAKDKPEPKIAPIYERLGEKVGMLTQIPAMCPECLCQCEVNFTPDRLRVSIKHHEFKGCSRSLTEVIRPIAQFTVLYDD